MIPDLVSVVAAPPGWWAFFKVDEPPGWGALPVAVWAVAKRTDAGETFLEVVPGVPDHPDDGGLLSDLSEIANYLGVWNEPTPPAGWVA